MGACGYYVSNQAVFFVTAALAVPALISLLQIKPKRSPSDLQAASKPAPSDPKPKTDASFVRDLRVFVTDRSLVVLAVSIALYYLSNAAMLPLIGSMLTLRSERSPTLLGGIQALDGISSAVIGVVIPLVAADATRHNGRYALAQGVLGTAMGLGASFSATFAGVMTDRFGSSFAFYGLTAIGVIALLVPLLMMPETREKTAS